MCWGWWRFVMETLSALMTLFVELSTVATVDFPHKWQVTWMDLWYFFCWTSYWTDVNVNSKFPYKTILLQSSSWTYFVTEEGFRLLLKIIGMMNWHEGLHSIHINISFGIPGGRFKNEYELLNLRALEISMLYKNHIFQCMGKIFCVEFQRVPLKFHTKYPTHTLKDVNFLHR